jgi:HD-GYP domain-containing protein (c-di-GMP phosphodiesterase class II)
MFTKGEALLVPDTAADPNWTVLPETSWVRSYLGIPIKKDGKVLGVINIDHENPNAFNESHIEIMEALSNQISTAMENADLYHQQQEQLEFLESLRQIDNAITGSLDLKVTLVVILTELMARLEVDAAEILLYDPDAFQIVSAARKGFQSSASGDYTMFQIGGLPGWIIQNRVTYSTSDLSQSDVPPMRTHLFEREKFISYYGTPLISKGKVVGVLELFRREIHQTDSRWIRYAETVATQTAIAIDNSRLFSNLQKANLDLSLAYDTTLEGWALGLELRDHETEGHSRRVVELTMELIKAMNIPEEEWIHIRRGALLHDIGKMGVPDRILQKPGKLDDEEWDLMRQHPLYAELWLRPISYLRPALDIPLYHHERWDGSGYPKGLKGTGIPLAARIFAVIDVWDALRSDRPYRKAWSKEKVIEHIKAETGKHFDPEVVTQFVKMIESNPDID